MVLESTVLCVDNSEYMRNGDYLPTRLQAQQDAANMICRAKLRSNPESNMALLSMSDMQVHTTLTTDSGKLLSKLNTIQPEGKMNFLDSVRVSVLALKHRCGKNHKTRIVVFVGSPITDDPKEMVKVAKKLKKEKVNVDIISFGEHEVNNEKLDTFIKTLNGKDGGSSHLLTIPSGDMLSGAIGSSPILVEEGGASMAATGGDFGGFDDQMDPELALALRVSLEEQRNRQQQENNAAPPVVNEAAAAEDDDDAMLRAALEMSMATEGQQPIQQQEESPAHMTEEEQLAYALRLSMEPTSSEPAAAEEEMETDGVADEAYMEDLLQNLPGMDPSNQNDQDAMDETKDSKKE